MRYFDIAVLSVAIIVAMSLSLLLIRKTEVKETYVDEENIDDSYSDELDFSQQSSQKAITEAINAIKLDPYMINQLIDNTSDYLKKIMDIHTALKNYKSKTVDPSTTQRVDPSTTQRVDPSATQRVDPSATQRVDPSTRNGSSGLPSVRPTTQEPPAVDYEISEDVSDPDQINDSITDDIEGFMEPSCNNCSFV